MAHVRKYTRKRREGGNARKRRVSPYTIYTDQPLLRITGAIFSSYLTWMYRKIWASTLNGVPRMEYAKLPPPDKQAENDFIKVEVARLR